MIKKVAKNHTDLAAGLIMLALFAVGMIASLLAGAGVYSRIVKRDNEAYDARISTQYLAEKINSAPAKSINLTTMGENGETALSITDSDGFVTYIYCCDGWLRELYTYGEIQPDFESGEKLLELQALEFKLEDKLLTADITTAAGLKRQVCAYLDCKEEESD